MAHIYVAGASKELDRVRRVMARLREAGHEITFDWTEEVAKYGSIPTDPAIAAAASDKDMEAIQGANLFIFLHPAPGVETKGAWYELGYASALAAAWGAPQVMLSYESRETKQPGSVFVVAPDAEVCYCYDDDILRVISELDLDSDYEDEDYEDEVE